MTMWLWFVLLSLGAVAIVLWRVFLPGGDRSSAVASDLPLNRELFEEKLVQLSAQRDQEEIDEAQFTALKTEYERQFIADNLDIEIDPNRDSRGRGVLIAAALLVPFVAMALYFEIGAHREMALRDTLVERAEKLMAGDESEDLVRATDRVRQQLTTLAERHGERPVYPLLLARLNMERGDYDLAASRYRRVVELLPDNGDIRAEYAQALFLAAGDRATEEVAGEARQALMLAPASQTALELMGIVSFQRSEFDQAIEFWRQALERMAPNAPDRQALLSGIAAARKQLGAEAPGDAAEPEGPELTVNVSLAENLDAAPETAVFVFARAWQGPAMPLAAKRLTVADLPAQVVLDDSSAMSPAMTLSGADRVEVVARVSFSGAATPSPGDLQGSSGPIDPASRSAPVDLRIDRTIDK